MSDMYCDYPAIAGDTLYVGGPGTVELPDDTGPVRVWSDDAGQWADGYWHRDGDELTIHAGVGRARVVEMVPVDEHESGSDFVEVG